MSRQYASQLLFELQPSKKYLQLVVLFAGVSFMSIFFIKFNLIIYSVLFLIIVGLIIFSLKNNVYRTMHWQKDGRWLIENKNIKQTALLQSGSVVTPFFAALKFKLENKKMLNVILFDDSLDTEKFRQLRLRLKVQGIKIIADI